MTFLFYFQKICYFLIRKTEGSNVKKRESKFYIINFTDPRITFYKGNFNNTCNEKAYSEDV